MSYPGLLETAQDEPSWKRMVAHVVNGIMQGRTNNYGTVTLAANAASTTVTLAAGRLSINSVILFDPTTLNASIEISGGTMYRSSTAVASNQFTITHSNDASTDRVFLFCIIG